MLRESSRTWIALLRTQVHLSISLVRFLTLVLSITLPSTVQAELSTLTETLTLTERRVVADALVRPALVEAETGRMAVAENMVTETGSLPNPVFAFSRDRLGLPGGDITERSVQVSQTFDFSVRRALLHEAATQRLDDERFDGRIRRLNTIAYVRRAAHTLLLTQADADLRNAWNQAEELRKTALTYRHDASDASHNLSRIAQEAYQAGEANLLELLDAYRTELDFATSELDIALGARLAYINLETLSGVSSYE